MTASSHFGLIVSHLSLLTTLVSPSFLSEVRRLSEANYVPTVADVLRARLKSTGILETRFSMGQLSIQ
jgi:guanine nucleotide-binding protein G(i) subunit alpha